MHRICSILSNFQLKCRKDKDDLSKEILLLLLFTKVMDKHVDMNKDGNLDVTNSSNTFKKLMEILPNNFKLIIK